MIIQLTERWRLRRYDDLNFVVEYYAEGGMNQRTKQKGPDRWVIKGYYSSLFQAIVALPDRMAFDPTLQSFEELEAAILSVVDRLEGLLDPLADRIVEAIKEGPK